MADLPTRQVGPIDVFTAAASAFAPAPLALAPLPIISFPSHPPLLHRESPLLARPPSSNFTEAPWSHSTEEEAINLAAPSIYLPLPHSTHTVLAPSFVLSVFLSTYHATIDHLTATAAAALAPKSVENDFLKRNRTTARMKSRQGVFWQHLNLSEPPFADAGVQSPYSFPS